MWRPAVLPGLCSSLVAGGFTRLLGALPSAVRCLFAVSAADCRATCALFRAPCESVVLSCSESVLLSCSNSPSWPSRSRCLVSVVTHTQSRGLVSVVKHTHSTLLQRKRTVSLQQRCGVCPRNRKAQCAALPISGRPWLGTATLQECQHHACTHEPHKSLIYHSLRLCMGCFAAAPVVMRCFAILGSPRRAALGTPGLGTSTRGI